MQAISYQNGIHRELKSGHYGPCWSLEIHAWHEAGDLWPSFCHVEGESWQQPHPGRDEGNGIRLVSLQEAFSLSPDYTPVFGSQVERDIYEHTPFEQSQPMLPHERADTCPRHLRPEELMHQAHCTPREAVHFADLLSILEASEEIAAMFCRWSRVKGAQPTLQYLYRLSLALAEAEAISPEDVLEHQSQTEYSAPETMAYHKVALDSEEEAGWIESRPYWFQKLIDTVQSSTEIEQLKQLCKEVYPHLHGDYMSVFLAFYNARKNYLESRAEKFMSKPAKAFIRRIREARSHKQLAAIGANLYKFQKGEIKGPEMKRVEWKFIWAAYNAAKNELTPKE